MSTTNSTRKPHPVTLHLLSLLLSLCILILSAHTYRVYHNQHVSNPWWLPVWIAHFDTSGLISSIICSVILVCVSGGQIFVCGKGLKTKMLVLVQFGLVVVGVTASLIMLIMPAVANARDPARSDTVQTWTCRWHGVTGAPGDFSCLCGMSRFTSYAPIPILVSQLLMLGKGVQEFLILRKQKRFGDEGEEELVRITKSVEVSGKHRHDGERDVESRGSV